MLNIRKNLGLFALVCTLAGLIGCGGGSGTDNKKKELTVCSGLDVILADGSCGEAPALPACPEGQIRDQGTCVESNFPAPTQPATVAADEVVIYINKASAEKDFAGYSVYTFNGGCGDAWANPNTAWESTTHNPISSTPETADPVYGGYFIIKVVPTETCGTFIIRQPNFVGNDAKKTSDIKFPISAPGPFSGRFFFIENAATGLVNGKASEIPVCINDVCKAYEKPALAISDISAHWVNANTILWDKAVSSIELYAANDGAKITANLDGTVAGGTLVATLTPTTLAEEEMAKTPQLSAFNAYAISLPVDQIKELLKKELVIVGTTGDNAKVGTRIQNYALLDSLYANGVGSAKEAALGAVYSGEDVTVSVWAPTATAVDLRLFGEARTPTIDGVLGNFPAINTYPMSFDSVTGIWSFTSTKAALDRKFYRYRVTGYNYLTNSTNSLEVSDPYAVSLSADGFYSQIVNLADADLKPNGWDNQVVPEVTVPEAMSIYEAHVRDFSILDESTPAAHRGKYLAFTDVDSAPVKHLKELQQAGLTHIHLLPINDGSSITESAGKKFNLDSLVKDLCNSVRTAPVCADPGQIVNTNANNLSTLREVFEGYAGDSDKARKLMQSLREVDSFNWNYDPQFFNAPEGSYSTNPDGITRIIEARAMNLALHQLGLRVVLDVVYPHMAASGIASANATFDKIVPGYYFRSNITSGNVVNNTGAGPDTATEHVMMGKFVADSVKQWAEQYKFDGFRFDQSGYMPKSVLLDAYAAVKTVDPDNYFYAEAWTAGGEEARSRVSELAAQVPLAGTGIGTYNDRMRNPLRELAIVNGGDLNAVRAGLAGNLANFRLLAKSDTTILASSVGQGSYNLDPQEAINYVEKHDGLTLWDWMHLPNALPANTTIENRVRIQALTLSVPLLSQGVPFIQMGSELLRSKSMDHNSYNSGDWFNYVDFTKQTNNWMVGLPLEHEASDENILAAFADPMSKPTPALIQQSSDMFNEFLAISKSPLFSLTTAEDVMDRVGFHDGGPSQVNNLIVLSIDDGAGIVAGTEDTARVDLDPNYDAIVVVFNGTNATVNHKIRTAAGFSLHPIQLASADSMVQTASFAQGAGADADKGIFTVPAYTTAVFVKVQAGAQGAGLLSTVTSGYEAPAPFGDSLFVRGSVFDDSWSAADGNKMTYSKGIYSATLTFAGAKAFKIADAGFTGATTFGGSGVGAYPAVLNTPIYVESPGQDIAISVPATAAAYTFKFDATDPVAPVLTVYEAADIYHDTPLYVRGNVFDESWSASDVGNKMAYSTNGLYSKTLELEARAYEFKIADASFAEVRTFGVVQGATVTLATPLSLESPGSNIAINIAVAGNYTFTIDTKATPKTITVVQAVP